MPNSDSNSNFDINRSREYWAGSDNDVENNYDETDFAQECSYTSRELVEVIVLSYF